MYTIETDLGRFEAETEREAKAAMRKAQKEQAKRDAEDNERHKAAMGRAYHNAYLIFDRKGQGLEFPQGWRIKPVTSQSYCCREVYDREKHLRGYQIETAEGYATAFPYDPITHVLENGSGFAMAVVIARQDCEIFAVGTHDGKAAWVPVFGVKAEEFRKGHD